MSVTRMFSLSHRTSFHCTLMQMEGIHHVTHVFVDLIHFYRSECIPLTQMARFRPCLHVWITVVLELPSNSVICFRKAYKSTRIYPYAQYQRRALSSENEPTEFESVCHDNTAEHNPNGSVLVRLINLSRCVDGCLFINRSIPFYEAKCDQDDDGLRRGNCCYEAAGII